MQNFLYYIRDNLVGTHYFIYAFILLFLMFALVGYLFKQKYGKYEIKLNTSQDQKEEDLLKKNTEVNKTINEIVNTVDKTPTNVQTVVQSMSTPLLAIPFNYPFSPTNTNPTVNPTVIPNPIPQKEENESIPKI